MLSVLRTVFKDAAAKLKMGQFPCPGWKFPSDRQHPPSILISERGVSVGLSQICPNKKLTIPTFPQVSNAAPSFLGASWCAKIWM
jgi:hypothetical protein